jgi:hypothetical protein
VVAGRLPDEKEIEVLKERWQVGEEMGAVRKIAGIWG